MTNVDDSGGLEPNTTATTTPEEVRQAAHEAKAKAFVGEIETLIVKAFHLGDSPASEVFNTRAKLIADLRELLREEFHNGRASAADQMNKLFVRELGSIR